jgi:PAS domain S-box-containing protein
MTERLLTVVIADGAQEERAALRETLGRDTTARYSIVDAATGACALELCRQSDPDCLILNHELPDQSGLEVLRKLGGERGEPSCPVVILPVVMLIDHGDARLAVAAMRGGASDCVERDRARGESLLRAVRQAVERTERVKAVAPRLMARAGHASEAAPGVFDFGAGRPAPQKSGAEEPASRGDRARSRGATPTSKNQSDGHTGGFMDGQGNSQGDAGQNRNEDRFQFFESAVEQSADSVIVTTSQLESPGPRIIYVNDAFTRMTGYSPEEVIGGSLRILQGPKTDPAVLEQLREDCEAGRVFRGETVNYRKDGSEFCVEWSVGPVRDERGKITGFISIQRDITERRRIEESLIESEGQLRSLFDLSTVGMAQVARDGRFVRINRKLCQMLGYTEEEMSRRTIYDITHPDDRNLSAVKLGSSFAEETVEYSMEKRYLRKDGETIWVLVNWSVLRETYCGEPRTVANIQDITARKRAEEALRENEAQLRAIIDHSAAIIFVKDLEGRYQRVNRWYEATYGLTESEVKGKTAYEFHSEEIADVFRRNDQKVLAERMPLQFEEEVPLADGTHHFISVKFLLYGDDGQPYAICGIATDITERKRMEQELRHNNEQLRIVLEAARMGTFVWEIQSDRLTGNERMRALLGLPADAKATSLSYFMESVLLPEDREAVAQAIKTAIKQGAKYQAEFRVNSPKADLRWVGIEGKVYYDAEKLPERMLGVARDITERKQAEEALKASEERLDLALESADIGTFDWDVGADVVIWTEKAKAIFGMPSSKTTVRFENWRERVHPEDLPVCEASLHKAFEENWQEWQARYRMIRADTGETRWIDSRGRMFYDSKGELLRMIGTNIDVTERKHAEEALKASEERFRSLIEQASDGIFVADRDWVYTEVNRSACQMLGYSQEELIGKRVSDLLPPEDVSRLGAMREGLLRGQAHMGEWRMRRKDGRYLLVEISAKIFPDGPWVAIVRDITERKLAEAEREYLLTREQSAREAAEAANRSKDEFLAVVSHELRSPLNAMLGYARLLRYGPPDAEKVRKAVEVIERNGRAQSQLIDDLLDTARIISGKLRLDVGPVELAAVVEDAVQTIYPAADAKNITIRAELAHEGDQITGDPVRLGQVIWNLLSNAVKFTPSGGQILIRMERVGPHIGVTVSDTGKGISAEFMPYIFDRFRQADASSARRYGGLGLGLTLVKHLVELHGGTIEVESAGEDQGASFKILLPVRAVVSSHAEAGHEALPAAAMGQAADLTGVSALVVDDEEDARSLVKSALEHFGAEVIAAGSADEGLAVVTSGQARIDVIVTDLGMPGENGYGLLRRFREWERARGLYTPAVALTAYGQTEDRIRALMAGFQTHVVKPVDPIELAVVIANLARRPNRNEKK